MGPGRSPVRLRGLRALPIVLSLTFCVGAAASPAPVAALEDSLDNVVGVVSQPFTVYSASTARFAVRVSTRIASTPGARLEFLLHRRVAGRAPFRAIASGEARSAVIDSVSFPLSRVPRTNSGLFTARVPLRTSNDSASSLTMRFAGVYPLTVRVTDAGGGELARSMTFLNRRSAGDDEPRVQVTTYARLASGPSIRTDGLVEVQDATRATVRRFINFLSAAPDDLTVSVEPELVAALAGSIEPADVQLFTELRDQLRARTVTAASFAQTDPSVMAARRLGDEFIAQVRLGERTLDRHLPGVPIRRATWIAHERLDERGLSLLRDAGINTVILSVGAQSGLASERPINVVSAIRPADGADMPIVAMDPLLADQLSMANPFPEQAGHRVAAEVVVIRDELLSSGVDPSRVRIMVSSPTGMLYDDSSLLVAARVIRATPGFAATDMAGPQSVADGDPDVLLPAPARRPTDGLTGTLRSLRTRLDAVLSMVSEDDPQRDTWRYMLGLATSTVGAPKEYASALASSLDSTMATVSITTPESINLSSRTGTIRFQIRNNSPHEFTVRVRLTSAKLDLAKRTQTVDLASGTTTEVQFSAVTRTNGRFPVVVRVTTPEGNVDVMPSVTFTAKVSALAGFGQLVSITFLLMLLAWWWSHRRRATRAEGFVEGNSENTGAGGTVLP